MKRIVIAALDIVLLFFICACAQSRAPFYSKLYEPYHIIDADVPYADNLNTHQFDEVYELETDSYGRRYFKYVCYSTILNEELEIHLISQHTDDNTLAYYQDYCYLQRRTDDEIFPDSEICAFKELNDWERPLDWGKMVSIQNDFCSPLLFESTFSAALLEFLDLGEENLVTENCMELYGTNRALYTAEVVHKDKDSGDIIGNSYYLVVVNLEVDGYIEACEKFEPVLDCQSIVHEFREKYLEKLQQE